MPQAQVLSIYMAHRDWDWATKERGDGGRAKLPSVRARCATLRCRALRCAALRCAALRCAAPRRTMPQSTALPQPTEQLPGIVSNIRSPVPHPTFRSVVRDQPSACLSSPVMTRRLGNGMWLAHTGTRR